MVAFSASRVFKETSPM